MLEEKRYWEDICERYQKTAAVIPWAGRLTNKYIRYAQATALEEIKSLLHNKEILEIGCGTGYWFNHYHRWGVKEVYGIDISGSMLKTSKTERVAEACATNLPFANEAFDVVVTVTVLQHLSRKAEVRKSLNETKRVLKEDGYAIFLELSQPYAVSPSAPLLSISKGEWELLFKESGLHLIFARPVDPSFLMFALNLLTHQITNLMRKRKDENELKALSSNSKLLRIYYLLEDALSIPSILLLRIARRFWPELSAHWVYILSKARVTQECDESTMSLAIIRIA